MPNPKRITSAVYAVFTCLAGAFVISSTYQIAAAVFAEERADLVNAPNLAPACADGLKTLAAAVDRGLAASAGTVDSAEAERRFTEAHAPEWNEPRHQELAAACTSDPRGVDALAAVTRFDQAALGAVRKNAGELEPVRRTALSYIR